MCKVIEHRTVLDLTDRQQSIRQSFPRASRRINLVRLEGVVVLKMLMIVVDEIPNLIGNLAFGPSKPVFNRRFYIEYGVPV